jgi:hypothetical protein
MTINPKNVLVFRSCGLGDFILSAPAFYLLRKRFPGSRITLLTLQTTDRQVAKKVAAYVGDDNAAPWVELLRPHLIDDVIVLDNPQSFAGFRDARRILNATKFDLVVQMIDVGVPWRRRLKKMLLAAALVGLTCQVGWRRRGTTEFGKVPATNPNLGRPVFGPMQFANELDHGNCTIDAAVFDLRPGSTANELANSWLAKYLTGRQRLVAIAPGAIRISNAIAARAVSIVPSLELPNSIEPWHNSCYAIRHPVERALCNSFTWHHRGMIGMPLGTVFDQCRKLL